MNLNELYQYLFNYAYAIKTRTLTKQMERTTEAIEDGFTQNGHNQQRQNLFNHVWKLAWKRAKQQVAQEIEGIKNAYCARVFDNDEIITNPNTVYDTTETFTLA